MIISDLSKKIEEIYLSYIANHNKIFLITDGASWALDSVANGLNKELMQQSCISSKITSNISKVLKKQIVHFINRSSLLCNNFPKSYFLQNHVFLNWYHWDPNDTSFESVRCIKQLKEIQSLLTGIITSCSDSKRDLVRVGIEAKKIIIIPLAIDLNYFKINNDSDKKRNRIKLGIPQDSFCIGSFQKDGCGWGEGNEPKMVKGPDVFVKTIELLSYKYKNIFILLTGPARGYVKEHLSEMGIPFKHQFIEDYSEISNYYSAIDLYLIASRAEGGPLAFLESWACGVPVVSTNMGMPKDLIQHGKNGLLAKVESPSELAQAVSLMIENRELREQCKIVGANDVKKYGWSTVAALHYEKIYKPYLF